MTRLNGRPARPTPAFARHRADRPRRNPPRRRVLFLSCHLPWPAISGGRRRELELIRRIAADFDVHLVVVSKTPEQDRAAAPAMAELCDAVDVFAAERAGDGRLPVQVARHHCPGAAGLVASLLAGGTVDLVHVEGYYLMQLLPEHPGVPVLLVEQNIEYELDHQRAAARSAGPADLGAYARAACTRLAETRSWYAADHVAVLTPEDRDTLLAAAGGREAVSVSIVPDGADHVELAAPAPAPGSAQELAPTIAFVANFAYAPNLDATEHLHDEILPRIRARVPDVRLWLVGNAPPPAVLSLASDTVTVTGRVDSVTSHLDAAHVVVIPLRIGGGIKVKAIEALRRGKAIVSSSIGAQGLPPAARQAVRVRDDPARFAAASAELLLDRPARIAQEARAREAASLLPSWDEAADRLRDVYAGLGVAAAREPAERLA